MVLGDQKRVYKGLLSKHSKGGEAGSEVKVYDAASVIGTIQRVTVYQCRGSPISLHETTATIFKFLRLRLNI